MAITIEQVEAMGRIKGKASRMGCWNVDPPIRVRVERNTKSELLTKGQVVHIFQCDRTGHYPGTFKIQEQGFWWNGELFNLVT